LEVSTGVWFLGEIERQYDNNYAVKGFETLRDGALVDDEMLDDTGLAVKIGDRALVIAGCSHSGISNIARKTRILTGASELIVLGGFHLVHAASEDIKRIIEELRAEGVVEVHTGHCTGLRGEAMLLEAYGDK